jgi:hypothetical protein
MSVRSSSSCRHVCTQRSITRLFCLVGAVGLEPTNPSLVRRSSYGAGRRLASAEEPVSWTDRRQASLYIAWCLPPLAPSLAPRNLVSPANQTLFCLAVQFSAVDATAVECPSRWMA